MSQKAEEAEEQRVQILFKRYDTDMSGSIEVMPCHPLVVTRHTLAFCKATLQGRMPCNPCEPSMVILGPPL